MQVLFTTDLFSYADIKASVAKDNYPDLSPGDEWTGADIDAFLKYMKWHRPDLASKFVLGGTVFQDELQPIMKTIDPDFPGPAPTPVVPEIQATVRTLAIVGSQQAQVGVETLYNAIATMSDGNTQDVTNTAMWTSSNIHAASVDRMGVVIGRVTGKSNLRASAGGVFSAPYPITVIQGVPPAATLVSIAVTGPATVTDGLTAQYTATGTMSDGRTQDLTSQVTWASSSTATATISASGLLTGVAAGSTDVTATLGTVASPAFAVTVGAATIVSINVTGAASVVEGGTSQYTATATLTDGATVDVSATATWTSTTTATATISASGLLTAVAEGSTTLTAAQDGKTSTALPVTVTAAP